MSTITVRALRTVVVAVGRSMAAGEVGTVDALTAAVLVAQKAAELVSEHDRPALHAAVVDDTKAQTGGRLGPRPGDPWRPCVN